MQYLWNISRKTGKIFCLQTNIKNSSNWYYHFTCVARHAQITQNNKFAISLQYLKKEMSDEIEFLHADKHESLHKLILWFLMGMIKHSQSSKILSLQCLYNILKNKLEMKLNFYMQINTKVSYNLISTLWTSKFSTSWYYHYWLAGLSIFKVLKVTSLQ